MRASFFKVEPSERASFRCVRVCQQKLGVPWHFHPEYQLTLVVRGVGQRVVGDSIEPLVPGDLTLLGPNVPHFWDVDMPASSRSQPRRSRVRGVDAVIVQFRAEFLGREFMGVPETAGIVKLLESSRRGLAFSGPVRRRVAPEIVKLPKLDGLQRLLALIGVLDLLAHGGRSSPICSAGYVPRLDETDRDRLTLVIQRIHEHLGSAKRLPGRGELAALAGIAERSFSRYFRCKMGRTLPQFVNELRVGRARRMLVETDLTIERVARACGFHNLSNFNGQFRIFAGTTPLAYRRARRQVFENTGIA